MMKKLIVGMVVILGAVILAGVVLWVKAEPRQKAAAKMPLGDITAEELIQMINQTEKDAIVSYKDIPYRVEDMLARVLPVAESGDIAAAVAAGNLYSSSADDSVAEKETFKWYKIAAEAGNAAAQYRLGTLYLNGLGTEVDYVKAKYWFEKALDGGNDQGNLGFAEMYVTGRGAEQDVGKALELVLPLAEGGDALAEFIAGSIYLLDITKFQNYSKGKYWLEKSAAQDFGGAYWIMGLMYASGMGYPQDIAKASELLERGDRQYALGGMFQSELPQVRLFLANANYYGIGMKQDPEKAVGILEEEIEDGNTKAAVQLGVWYVEGKNISQNTEKALILFKKAAEKNNDEAICYLGAVYEFGEGVAVNVNEALKWYRYGADLGLPYAQANLGRMYMDGIGVAQDYKQAVELFRLGTEQDHPYAKMGLAVMLYKGWGVSKNTGKALILLKEAAAQGNTDAQEIVDYLTDK